MKRPFCSKAIPGSRNWLDAINPGRKRHRDRSASWAAGLIMLIWIAVETGLLGYISFLQPAIAIYAGLIITLTLLPGVRRFYAR